MIWSWPGSVLRFWWSISYRSCAVMGVLMSEGGMSLVLEAGG